MNSATDSCRVLGQPGAEQLTGAGDALFLPVTASRPVRIQSAFVTDAEISTAVGDAARTWAQPRAPGTAAAPSARAEVAEYQALVAAAAELVISTQFGSVAML